MMRYSLRRRLIAIVLLLEFALAAGISASTLCFIWRGQMHAFDAMLRGRADSLLGAVHDAEDAGDNVAINPEALDLHKGDLWMARDARGPALAHSANWIAGSDRSFPENPKPKTFRLGGSRIRGLVLHGVRQIDADDLLQRLDQIHASGSKGRRQPKENPRNERDAEREREDT